jgi:Zn finger protein HypA/HybF involved in hydrogenase expression
MHEYGVALEIADLAIKTAGNRPITKVNLRIGALSGVFSESLVMYLELLLGERQGKAPAIAVTNIGAKFRCSCGSEYAPGKIFDPCPSCGGFDRSTIDGNDCTIESIEVDDDGKH